MERGPMALFGAIVAVGLGPAMWLGTQFGQVTLPPERPPVVTSVQENGIQPPRGGSGAGDAPNDQTEAIRTEPKANTEPLKATRKARPVVTPTTPAPSASEVPSPEPTETSSPPTDPGDPSEPSDPPTESTTEPTDPPTEDDPVPPPPPTADPEAEPVADDGFGEQIAVPELLYQSAVVGEHVLRHRHGPAPSFSVGI